MGIIDDHPVTTRAGDGAGGHSLPEAHGRVLKLQLGVLVFGQGDVRPAGLIPLRHHQPAHTYIVADGEVLAVAGAQVAQVGHALRPPLPRRPEHAHQERLHRAWGDVDEEPVELDPIDLLTGCDSLEVSAQGIDVPAMDIGLPRLDDVPCELYKRRKALLAIGAIKLEEGLAGIDGHAVDLDQLGHSLAFAAFSAARRAARASGSREVASIVVFTSVWIAPPSLPVTS